MQKPTSEVSPPKLEDLLNDGRLERLFSQDARHCALQLWVLQLKSDQSIENRVIYGRLLPYSHSNGRWSSSHDDNFQTFGQVRAQVVQLNLYLKSIYCADVIRGLSAGRTVSAISDELKLGLSDRFKERFGATALAADELVYRPVAYLLNRDAYDKRSLSSPHGGAGALSASITQTDKVALFRQGQDYNVALTASIIKRLNEDTGLDFSRSDTVRFGDLELLVFPALDDSERRLLNVSWRETPHALIVQFDPMQVPHFGGFQFHLSIANDDQIVYSGVATAERNEENIFECKFELSDQLRASTDSTELEIFGFHDGHPGKGTLCCRWRIGYIREIHLRGHVVGHEASQIKFDWLEKATRPSASARMKAALTVDRGNRGFTSHIGGREADPWVRANRDIASIFKRIHPPKSEGRFFLRWSQGDGEGRLQFVEWFKALLAKYPQHQIVIFDPYFESAGLGMVLLAAPPTTDCIVFRSLPKKSFKNHETTPFEPDKSTHTGIDNLMANCERNRHLLKKIKLRIYGLKDGRLHDRYILIIGPDNSPVAGFNLSNSLQGAAQDQPMLVTPIPADVLLKVEQYQSELLQEGRETQAGQARAEAVDLPVRTLFDSTAASGAPRRYEPLLFIEKAKAGDVLSVCIGEPSLRGMNGEKLKERMVGLGLLKEESLVLPETAGLRNILAQQAGQFASFAATWEVLGDVLAHSHYEERHLHEVESEDGFLEFLAQFLDASFNRTFDDTDKELAVMDVLLFQQPIETLIHGPYRPHHLFHATKYAALTWSEYFTVKLLWWYSPDTLLEMTEAQVARLPIESQRTTDAVRLSLLSQIVSEISLSIQFDINEVQRNGLVRSRIGLLQWMGLNAIERQMEKTGGIATVLRLVAAFSYPEQVRALGWMVNRAARSLKEIDNYNGLVAALHETLPATVSAVELRRLVDSMRGHMRQLAWAEPWLFHDVVFPLLQNDRASTDDACEIWMQELCLMLEPEFKDQPPLFDRAREGQTTNITAFLFANSGADPRQAGLKSMQAILKRQQRILQRPLASTSNWTQWDGALVVSMWILSFTVWGQYYLLQRGMTDRALNELSRQARELAMLRPRVEWPSKGADEPGELTGFLDQAEKLLASGDESKINPQ